MVILDVLYVALATIAVMAVLQLVTFVVTRMMYPPEPKVVYQQVPVYQQPVVQSPPVAQALPVLQPPPIVPQFPTQNGPALTQQTQEVQLPEYEPRKPATTSARVDTELPPSLQAISTREA